MGFGGGGGRVVCFVCYFGMKGRSLQHCKPLRDSLAAVKST